MTSCAITWSLGDPQALSMGSLASWVALALGSAGVLCQDLVCPSTVFPSWPVSPKLWTAGREGSECLERKKSW